MLNRRKTRCSVLIVLAASAVLTTTVRAQDIDVAKALKVKAAYLYNFAKFIEWPDDALRQEEAPFVIGILGDDPFGPILDATVKAKRIAQRPVRIRRLRWGRSADRAQLTHCQVLYVSHTERGRLKEIIAAVAHQPVLLVADMSGFAGNGGMIGFVLEQRRIIFEVNREALARARLKASARLLKLARIVKPRNPRLGGIRGS